jgi:hypothetical protein
VHQLAYEDSPEVAAFTAAAGRELDAFDALAEAQARLALPLDMGAHVSQQVGAGWAAGWRFQVAAVWWGGAGPRPGLSQATWAGGGKPPPRARCLPEAGLLPESPRPAPPTLQLEPLREADEAAGRLRLPAPAHLDVFSANALTRAGAGAAAPPGRARAVPRRLVVDVREFVAVLPGVLHRQGFYLTPVTLEVGGRRLWARGRPRRFP